MVEVFADSVAYHNAVHTFGKPLVVAVNGAALGGGCDRAAMCDTRLAASHAVFGQPQVRFGAAAAYDLMREVIPVGAAREMCLTGRSYGAAEAHVLHETDALVGAALELAQSIAALPGELPTTAKQQFLSHQPRLFDSRAG